MALPLRRRISSGGRLGEELEGVERGDGVLGEVSIAALLALAHAAPANMLPLSSRRARNDQEPAGGVLHEGRCTTLLLSSGRRPTTVEGPGRTGGASECWSGCGPCVCSGRACGIGDGCGEEGDWRGHSKTLLYSIQSCKEPNWLRMVTATVMVTVTVTELLLPVVLVSRSTYITLTRRAVSSRAIQQ